jgi:hypothetical protein
MNAFIYYIGWILLTVKIYHSCQHTPAPRGFPACPSYSYNLKSEKISQETKQTNKMKENKQTKKTSQVRNKGKGVI